MRRFAATFFLATFALPIMAQQSPPSLPPELLRSIDEFNNRKKYSAFDVATLRSIKDEHLEQAILDYIFSKLDAVPQRRYQALFELSRGFQVVYLSWLVEAEVMNGGFNQYFWNSSGEFADSTPAALVELGDLPASELMKHATAIAIAEIPTMRKFRQTGTLESFSESYKHTGLNELDTPFCKRAEFFPSLRVKYIRSHEELFVTP
jgi:hypothetical protein